ncbi:hypothetical protein EMCG_04689 [[Emmonsia] crescens]|uniref:Uncharacterized protein n=1 Tax=[Emmonsia] crescens TaxID=73230 RepID=A0A0G2HRK1_9EURO|nr:hypothetical protein EMCG_04689 [Emmonsia crescens UAMH 3008]
MACGINGKMSCYSYRRLHSYRKCEVESIEYLDNTKARLTDIEWDISENPDKAKCIIHKDDLDEIIRSVDLTKEIFEGPVLIYFKHHMIEAIDTTVGALLQLIHKVYNETDSKQGLTFEGLTNIAYGVWAVETKEVEAEKVGYLDYLKDETPKLDNIYWNIRQSPDEAKYYNDKHRINSTRLNKEELKTSVFPGPILLSLCDRDDDIEWVVPISDTTIEGLLRKVHQHYKAFEKDVENDDSPMRDTIWLQGLENVNGALWVLDFEE